MSQTVTEIKYTNDYQPENADLNTLYVVYSKNSQSIDLFFNNKQVRNFEIVDELNQDLCDDKFYALRKGSTFDTIHYKHFDPDKEESVFIPIYSFGIEECTFSKKSGLKFVINGKSLRVLTLSDTGHFSTEDLSYILGSSKIPEMDCRIIWEMISHE